MNQKSSTANDPATAQGTTVARPRRRANQKAQERRRAVMIAGIFLGAAIIALLAVSTQYPTSSHATDVISNSNSRTAIVTSSSIDDKNCRQQVFDNQTGRMTRSEQPCDTNAFDNNGVMAPSGSIHRLDAISKSFSGR